MPESHSETTKLLNQDEIAEVERDLELHAQHLDWSPSDGPMEPEQAALYYKSGAAGYRLLVTQPETMSGLIATIRSLQAENEQTEATLLAYKEELAIANGLLVARDERIRALKWAARRAVREFRAQGEKDHAMDATDAINALWDVLTEEADDG